MDWEKIFANDAMNKVNLQNIQTAHGAQYQKKWTLSQKMDWRPKETALRRRHTDGQETHEKMFNITNY